MRSCSTEGCTKAHRAKGLCATHYNQLNPNRHLKVMVNCSGCGSETLKERRAQRYRAYFCSQLCRDHTRWGPTSCTLPATHPARQAATPRKAAKQPVLKGKLVAGNCPECDSAFVAISTTGIARYCSQVCEKRSHKRTRRAREHGATGTFRYSEVMRQYMRQGSACAYCKQSLDVLPDPEHVMPLSRGGRNDMSNIVASCSPCNSDKRDLTLMEWRADRARRHLPPVDTELGGVAYLHLVRTEPNAGLKSHLATTRAA